MSDTTPIPAASERFSEAEIRNAWRARPRQAVTGADRAIEFVRFLEARAALSHPCTAQGWQPIESAPKDGTPIIITNILEGTVFDVCNGNFEVVEEDEEDGPWDIRGGEPWCSYVGRAAGTYFCTWLPGYEREDRWRVTDSFEYTHWIPLPPPPEQGGKG